MNIVSYKKEISLLDLTMTLINLDLNRKFNQHFNNKNNVHDNMSFFDRANNTELFFMLKRLDDLSKLSHEVYYVKKN